MNYIATFNDLSARYNTKYSCLFFRQFAQSCGIVYGRKEYFGLQKLIIAQLVYFLYLFKKTREDVFTPSFQPLLRVFICARQIP